MSRRRVNICDENGVVTGTMSSFEEESSLFDLYDQEEGCPKGGYEGPLELKRRGWRCPDCFGLIIPNE